MTGATCTGIAIPVFDKEMIVEGSLQEAIFHLSKNQSELNEMFENVIVDFQPRLIENQGIVINSIVNMMQEIDGIKKCIKTMTEAVLLMQQVVSSNCIPQAQTQCKKKKGGNP